MFRSLVLLVGIFVYAAEGQTPATAAMACFNSTIDVISLHDCLATYFATGNSLSITDWNSMLPSADEISQYKQLVKATMDATGSSFCNSATLVNYPQINDDITMILFMNYYCVIVEKIMRPGKNMFNRAWGYVIITDKAWAQRNLHHSAPHPVSELYTPLMSSSIFYITRSRSLINAGASREAVSGAISPCIADDLVADAAHDNRTMFHALSAAVYEHESSCPASSCAFIQWHSFANNSCNDTRIIISTGVDNSEGIYNNNNLPAIRIAKYFNQLGTNANAMAKTAKDSTCDLLALDNIQGRLFNGVAAGSVCTVNPVASHNAIRPYQTWTNPPSERLNPLYLVQAAKLFSGMEGRTPDELVTLTLGIVEVAQLICYPQSGYLFLEQHRIKCGYPPIPNLYPQGSTGAHLKCQTVTGAFVNVNLEEWLEDVSRWAQTISLAFPTNSGSELGEGINNVVQWGLQTFNEVVQRLMNGGKGNGKK